MLWKPDTLAVSTQVSKWPVRVVPNCAFRSTRVVYTRSMKRFVAAALWGFAIAFAIAAIGHRLSSFTDSTALQWLLWVPTGWPTLILERILPENAFPIRGEYRPIFLIYLIVSNVLLYGMFSYFFLSALSLSEKSKQAQKNVPPPPSVHE